MLTASQVRAGGSMQQCGSCRGPQLLGGTELRLLRAALVVRSACTCVSCCRSLWRGELCCVVQVVVVVVCVVEVCGWCVWVCECLGEMTIGGGLGRWLGSVWWRQEQFFSFSVGRTSWALLVLPTFGMQTVKGKRAAACRERELRSVVGPRSQNQ